MASRLPSGDHESGDEGAPGGKLTGSVHAPEVRRVAALLASAAINQTWAGRGASCSRKWLFWISNARLWRSSPVTLGASSDATYAISLDAPGRQLIVDASGSATTDLSVCNTAERSITLC